MRHAGDNRKNIAKQQAPTMLAELWDLPETARQIGNDEESTKVDGGGLTLSAAHPSRASLFFRPSSVLAWISTREKSTEGARVVRRERRARI